MNPTPNIISLDPTKTKIFTDAGYELVERTVITGSESVTHKVWVVEAYGETIIIPDDLSTWENAGEMESFNQFVKEFNK